MKPINDEQLQAHLSRRSAETLTASERETLLGTVAATRVSARTWSFRPAFVLAPLAAVVLAVLMYPVLLTITSGPAPTAPPGALTVYSAQELSDMIGNPAWVGHWVLAQAQIGNMMSGLPCTAPDPCEIATLGGLSPGSKNVVSIAWRDAPNGEGVPIAGPRRVEQLTIPRQPGVFVFKVLTDSVEYLGPLRTGEGAITWAVNQLGQGNHDNISDDLLAVTGWLVQTSPVSCPPPNDYGPDVSTEFWCGGSFVTEGRYPTQSGNNYYLQLPGLHVQWDAYNSFALDQQRDPETGPEPRLGTYLVRSVGCPAAVMGDCPVWRMVGRLDGNPNPAPSPRPSPEATAAPTAEAGDGVTIYTAQQLSDRIGDPNWIDRVVLGQAQIAPMLAPLPGCQAPTPCEAAFLAGVSGKNVVSVAWRDAPAGEGQRVDDGSEVRWLQLLTHPSEPGLFAFRILSGSVEYLGPVVENVSDVAWPADEVPVGDPEVASDDLYAVDGWLLETIIASCPAPNDYGPDTSTEYWCGGSFLRVSPAGAPQTSNVFDLGGLHVQWGAYLDFAPEPSANHGQGTEPRYGTYLVRQIGCQPVVEGTCPVWRMVGRLD